MRAFNGLLIALALALIALVSVTLARAQSSSDVLAKFATDDFSDTAEAIAAVAASGKQDGRADHLRVAGRPPAFDAKSKNIFIRTPRRHIDAATGQPAAAAPAEPSPCASTPPAARHRSRRTYAAGA